MMKMRSTMLLVLALALVMSGCSHIAGESTQLPSGTEDVHSGVIGEPEPGYAYSNRNKNLPSGNYVLDGDHVLFVYITADQCQLYTYNTNTGETLLYCTDATCNHLRSGCVSKSIDGNLESYEGTVFGMTSRWSLVERKDGFFVESDVVGKVNRFFHAYGDLYVTTADNALLRYPEGTGEPQTILAEHTGYWDVLLGDYLYYTDSVNVYRKDLSVTNPTEETIVENALFFTDGHHIYYTTYDTQYLYRCDMNGDNCELLVDKPLLATRAGFDDTYFYYALNTDFTTGKNSDGSQGVQLYRFPKNDPTQQEFLTSLPVTDAVIYTVPGCNQIFLDCCVRDEAMTSILSSSVYVMNPDGSNLQKLELPEA